MWTLAVLTAYDQIAMSTHSYSRCWIHLIWGTLNREKLLNKTAAARVSRWLSKYAEEPMHLHENQLRKRRPCPCAGGSSHLCINRETDPTSEGKFLPLGQ